MGNFNLEPITNVILHEHANLNVSTGRFPDMKATFTVMPRLKGVTNVSFDTNNTGVHKRSAHAARFFPCM